MRVATIRWGNGRTHLYRWDAVRTLCGKDAPDDWSLVEGGVTYEATRHYMQRVDCRSCLLAATSEALADGVEVAS